MDARSLTDLVGFVYQGVIEETLWETLLIRLQTIMNTRWISVMLDARDTDEPPIMVSISPDGVSVAQANEVGYHYFARDPFIDLPPDTVVTPEELIGEDAWFGGAFFREFIQPADVRFILGADFQAAPGHRGRFRACRTRQDGAFTEGDRELVRMLLVHFEHALRVHNRLEVLETERKLYATTLTRMQVGTVILDEQGNVQSLNRVAEDLLAEGDGLRNTGGRIQAMVRNENQQLQQLIGDALGGTAPRSPVVIEALSVSRSAGKPRLGVLIRTIALGEKLKGQKRAAVVVFIRDPERRTVPSYEMLRRVFSLTRAEAALAQLLAEGFSLDEAAVDLGLSKNTVRAQLRSIFAKTGVSRQSSLVPILLGSVASL
ncbi:MAG: helix-turn-helix transcriptional regulator [Proteobacteria bacterium]|nr:helix-turn-helix transcriptional regulator [Pseudomonadota bacterium]HQR03154.1 helix-turn-helix transcriptional regulator [Rhodocyclaceae bacterium]